MSREDILAVDRGYDEHEVPIDAFYLDLHHTGEGIRYFTWNEKLFPDPSNLLQHFHAKHRWIVTIQDPHLALEEGYHAYDEMKNHVVRRDGTPFVALAWPGKSVYVDFVDE